MNEAASGDLGDVLVCEHGSIVPGGSDLHGQNASQMRETKIRRAVYGAIESEISESSWMISADISASPRRRNSYMVVR